MADVKVMLLGAGRVGRAIALDLTNEPRFRVTVVDRRMEALRALQDETGVDVICADIQDLSSIPKLVANADLVVGALPGFMGYRTLEAIIRAGKDVVDISFFPEDPWRLDALAREQGVTAVVDCGVAPGLSNILGGYAASQLDRVEQYICYVGGLPEVRKWPYEYKAVFSPTDVIEEYTRPARVVEHGRMVFKPALSEVERIELPGVDTLEAFLTDGLRTLVHTLDAPFMKEKTLRYPGHAELMRIFRESGFFDDAPIEVQGHLIRPRQLTERLLFDQWKLAEGEHDLTVMRVVVVGKQDGAPVQYTFDLLDRYDDVMGVTSMARTTGFTCAIVARMVAFGQYHRPGLSPPEYLGLTPGLFDVLMREYARRGIHVHMAVQPGK